MKNILFICLILSCVWLVNCGSNLLDRSFTDIFNFENEFIPKQPYLGSSPIDAEQNLGDTGHMHSENSVISSVNCSKNDVLYNLKINFIFLNSISSTLDINLGENDFTDEKIRCDTDTDSDEFKIIFNNSLAMKLVFTSKSDSIELNDMFYNVSKLEIEHIRGENISKLSDHNDKPPYIDCLDKGLLEVKLDNEKRLNLLRFEIECQIEGNKPIKTTKKTTTKKTKTTTKSLISTKTLNSEIDCNHNNMKLLLKMSFIVNNNTVIEQKDMSDYEKVTCGDIDEKSIVTFDNSLGLRIEFANKNDDSIELQKVDFRIPNSENEILSGNALKSKISKSNNILNCLDESSLKLNLNDKKTNYNGVQSIKFECLIKHVGGYIEKEEVTTAAITTTSTIASTIKIEDISSSTKLLTSSSNNNLLEHKSMHSANIFPVQIKMNQFFPIVLAVCLLILIVFSVVGYFFNRSLNNLNYRRFEI
jgi:hypothetical protein